MAGIYTINHNAIVVATAITIIQYKAGATNKAAVVRFRVGQGLSETSTQEQIVLLRKTAAATVSSFTPIENDPDGPVAFGAGGTAATGITASAEGTDGDLLVDASFNILNGFEWVRSDRYEIMIPAAGIIALKFPVAPASATWRAQLVIEEF
mgnify:CR=1 FL=1